MLRFYLKIKSQRKVFQSKPHPIVFFQLYFRNAKPFKMQLTLEFTILLGHRNILTRLIEHYNSVHKPKVDLSKSTKPSDTSKLAFKAKSMKRKIPLPTNFFAPKKGTCYLFLKWANLLQYSTVQYLQCYILSFRNCWQQQRTTDRQQLQITIENSTIDKQDKIFYPNSKPTNRTKIIKKIDYYNQQHQYLLEILD